jgi:hypothetical protein
LLTTLAGSTGLGALLVIGSDNPQQWFHIIITAITLSGAILSSLMPVLNWTGNGVKHGEVGARYSNLYRKIKVDMATPKESRKDAELIINELLFELNDIETEAPSLHPYSEVKASRVELV